MDLTDEQKAIITLGYEHCVITAVAGSGKTTTLAWRIRHLLEQGHDPQRMLILMFNRSARTDFERKLRNVTRNTGLPLPEIRTYHAMGFRLYKRFVKEGYLPPFSEEILSDQEIHFQVWQLTRQLAPEDLQSEIRRSKKEFVETAAHFIDLVKTTLDPVEKVFEELGYDDKYRYLIDLFHGFEQWRKRLGRISFADMLYEPVMAIHQNPPLQAMVGNKMDLMLVDEYQDTNEIQHLLLRYIAGDRARVAVVGDPDQTIYEFRGARPEFILRRFSEEFDSPKELSLSYTFRYGHRVALLANHLISHNRGRKDVLCHSHPTTPRTEIHFAAPRDDADYIVHLAENAQKQGQALDHIAVLFRIWSQSVPIELRLLARQIPYQIDANKGALFTREVDSMIQLLRLAAGRLGEASLEARIHCFRNILRFPHVGLAEQELNPLVEYLAGFANGWGQLLENLDSSQLKPLPARKLRRLGRALQALENATGSAAELIREYAETTELFEGIRSLALTHETADERIGTVTGFQRYLQSLDVDAENALTHLDQLREQARQSQGQGLHLSTMHRTKGLEWPVVVIPGLRDKIIPYTARGDEDLGLLLESERRLLYVAMTRSKEALHLLSAPSTDQGGDRDDPPSRFVDELCFDVSEELGRRLHGDEAQDNLELNHPLTPITHRYAQLHGVTVTAKEGIPPVETEGQGPVWQYRSVNHAIFGEGEVIREEDGSFEVKFRDGRTLNFSKKSAHLYFTKGS
ncbi:ATP-dependent helicase [Marinobacteraceae bacterium S3BR75-40.1]